MQGLRCAMGRRHQHADFGKSHARLIAQFLPLLIQCPFHIAQISAGMACFIMSDGLIDGLDDWLRMPVGCAAIPVIQANFAAEVQHQCFHCRRRIELEANLVQLFFGWHQVGAETTQIFDQDK